MKRNGTIAIVAIIIALVLSFIITGSQEDTIRKEITSIGGTVENIDEKVFNYGPFYYKGKNCSIYQVKYIDKQGNKKEAWVRTGWTYDWVWDYTK